MNVSTPGMPGSFGRCSGPYETRLQRIATVRLDYPACNAVIPTNFGHLGLEDRAFVEVECLADGAAVFQYLRRPRVLFDRHVADLFEQRQVDVALDIASRARIAVPVPGAAEIPALLDDPDIFNPGLLQSRPGKQTTKAAAHHDHLDIIEHWRAFNAGDVRIVEIVRVPTRDLDILFISVLAKPLVALGAVFGFKGSRVESQLRRCFGH